MNTGDVTAEQRYRDELRKAKRDIRRVVIVMLSLFTLTAAAAPPVPDYDTVHETDGSRVDIVMAQALRGVTDYWRTEGHEVKLQMVSFDADDPRTPAWCAGQPQRPSTASVCYPTMTVVWERGRLGSKLIDVFGDLAADIVAAHEVGHVLDSHPHAVGKRFSAEQFADCMAGVYMRHRGVHPDDEMATWAVLAYMQDRPSSPRDGDQHGDAYERIDAYRAGFADGPAACAALRR